MPDWRIWSARERLLSDGRAERRGNTVWENPHSCYLNIIITFTCRHAQKWYDALWAKHLGFATFIPIPYWVFLQAALPFLNPGSAPKVAPPCNTARTDIVTLSSCAEGRRNGTVPYMNSLKTFIVSAIAHSPGAISSGAHNPAGSLLPCSRIFVNGPAG
jgi:hypothetical protein